MTEAKIKADELMGKYYEFTHKHPSREENAIDCALLCVEEVIKTKPFLFVYNGAYGEWESKLSFWQEVRDELNKMK